MGFAPSNYLIKTDFRAAYVSDALANRDSLIAGTGLLPAANPQNNLRKALKDNDLRGYIPKMPTLLCGGNQDPTVFFDINTGSVSAIAQAASSNTGSSYNITVLDVDKTNAATRPNRPTVTSIGSAMSNPWMSTTAIDAVQNRFATNFAAVSNGASAPVIAAGGSQAQAGQAAQAAILGSYHGGLASAACTDATRRFFDQNFN